MFKTKSNIFYTYQKKILDMILDFINENLNNDVRFNMKIRDYNKLLIKIGNELSEIEKNLIDEIRENIYHELKSQLTEEIIREILANYISKISPKNWTVTQRGDRVIEKLLSNINKIEYENGDFPLHGAFI